jgi:hypothetical protein
MVSRAAFFRGGVAALELKMTIPKFLPCVLCGLVLALASCAAPKAITVAAAPATKKEEPKVPEPVAPEPMLPGLPNDGIRGSDTMLALPGEGDFRATNPALPKPGGASGAVIARPPTDPPSRVKPKADEPE